MFPLIFVGMLLRIETKPCADASLGLLFSGLSLILNWTVWRVHEKILIGKIPLHLINMQVAGTFGKEM